MLIYSVSGVKFLRLFSDYRNGLVSRVALLSLSVSIYLSSRPYSPLTKRESVSSWKSVKVENVQIHSIVNSVDNGQIFGFEQNVCNAPLVCWGSVTIFSSVICGASKGTFSALSLIIKCVKVYSINTVELKNEGFKVTVIETWPKFWTKVFESQGFKITQKFLKTG